MEKNNGLIFILLTLDQLENKKLTRQA